MMLRVLPALLPAMLGLPAQGLSADPLYPDAGTPTRWFLSLDKDQNGYLDGSELQLHTEWTPAVAAADQNNDLRIDHSEFLSLLDRMLARR